MLQQRRPRLHTLDQGSSIGHDIAAASDAATSGHLSLHHHHTRNGSISDHLHLSDDEGDHHDNTPRRKLSTWPWVKRNYHRRSKLLKYSVVGGVVCLIVILTITRTLGIRLFAKPVKNAAYFAADTATKDSIYPPPNIHISAIVMNHARPNLLQHSALLPTLLEHPTISQILILHSNPLTAFGNVELSQTLGHPSAFIEAKIQHINATEMNAKLGLAVRFYYCAHAAQNDWVLHVDDDMELDDSAINELVAAMIQDSHRIVGHYGRTYSYWSAPFRHGYDTKDVFGAHVEVVLTKLLILERTICNEFVQRAPAMDDMVQLSHPHWNGEDIFVNLVANQYYKVPYNGPYRNYAIRDLHVWEADTDLYPEHPTVVDAVAADITNKKAQTGKTNTVATVQEEVSISGNMDRNRIWNVGPVTFVKAYFKAQEHTVYRGRLWYQAKRRLAGFKD